MSIEKNTTEHTDEGEFDPDFDPDLCARAFESSAEILLQAHSEGTEVDEALLAVVLKSAAELLRFAQGWISHCKQATTQTQNPGTLSPPRDEPPTPIPDASSSAPPAGRAAPEFPADRRTGTHRALGSRKRHRPAV